MKEEKKCSIFNPMPLVWGFSACFWVYEEFPLHLKRRKNE